VYYFDSIYYKPVKEMPEIQHQPLKIRDNIKPVD
jgi:hypothetical protein